MSANVYANESDALEQSRPLSPRFWEVQNEPYADEPRYLDGWYWMDEACEEPMGPFDSEAEARADHREMREFSADQGEIR